jgi:hypothetical protein
MGALSYSVVQGDELCQVSSLPLLSRPFFKFPCGCGIITEHLIEYVRGTLPRYKREKLERLEDQLKAGVTAQREAELLRDIDGIVAADCPMCGEAIIDTIDQPFVNEEDQEAFMKTWSLKPQ